MVATIIVFILWFTVGFVSTLWGLRSKEARSLFCDDDDVIVGICTGFITLFLVIGIEVKRVHIYENLYNLVNKKEDKDGR